jgi:hypothetical protein
MFIQCLKHNYSGTSIVCPECFQEQQDRRYKVEITNEAMKIINKANELREKRLENYKILYEAEHRRRVAAEKTIAEMRSLWEHGFEYGDGYNFRLWQQSIIDYDKAVKEVVK